LEFNVPFQHKYGYIRDDVVVTLQRTYQSPQIKRTYNTQT